MTTSPQHGAADTPVTVRPVEPADEPAAQSLVAVLDLGSDASGGQGHYLRRVAVDGQGVVLGVLDGVLAIPAPPQIDVPLPAGPLAHVSVLGVRPKARRRGVATALVHAFVVEAQQHGAAFLVVMPSLGDDATDQLAFFHGLGLRDLVSDDPGNLVGAPIVDILAHIASTRRNR